jgi:hypothetical protein
MVQVLIWILCVYLIVKGFEILSNPAQRNAAGMAAAIVALIGAPLLLWFSIDQAGRQPTISSSVWTMESAADSHADPQAQAQLDQAAVQESVNQALENAQAVLDAHNAAVLNAE